MYGKYLLKTVWFEIFMIVTLIVSQTFISCEAGKTGTPLETRFTAAVWNIQSLYDGIEAGNEYDEFREKSGWTQEKYEARLLSIARAITGMIPAENGSAAKTPDLIGLVELENAGILEDLAKGHLLQCGYTHAFFGNTQGMSLGAGVLSRHPFTEAKVHSITMNSETIPRPVLEVRIEPSGEPLVFFLCHWKSKLGGEDATESLRRASARVIGRRIGELRLEKPGVPVIVMGDLNENHDEFYRRSGIVSALMPDDPEAAMLAKTNAGKNDFLILSNEKPPRTVYFDPAHAVLYTPWENELSDGSYYFRNTWETIDHLLLSEELFDDEGWDFDACQVLNFPPFTNAKGFPNPYNPRNGLGLSDHLPLLLWLRINE